MVAVIRPTSETNLIKQSPNIEITPLDVGLWAELVAELSPDVVICAQWDGVAKKDRNNRERQIANVSAITEIAKIARESKVKKFIVLGSQAETTPSEDLIPEEPIDAGDSWYGKSKSELHQELRKILSGSDTKIIWARVFSVYGPGESRDSLIPAIWKTNQEGKTFEVLEPNRHWSFLFVDDFALAIEALIESEDKNSVVNIAQPKLLTIKEICSHLPGAKVTFKEEDEFSSQGFYPETRSLISYGWETKTPIHDGCRITWESFK